ncbi:MAG: cytochrome c oxidase assembly protein [Thaumarchaeota archaeon]|nr:cytochrome c oxidase assembly protein [Nitrososphaerota archaeon]
MVIGERRKDSHRFLSGILRVILGVFLAAALTTDAVELLEEMHLAFHMLPEHIAYILVGGFTSSGIEKIIVASIIRFRVKKGGVLLARVYSTFSKINIAVNKKGVVGIAIISILLVYWHMPENFTLAVLSQIIHHQMHFSFILIGGIMLALTKVLSRVRLLVLLIAVGKVMALYGFYLSTVVSPIYVTYNLDQHGVVGLIMSASMIPVIAVSVIYLVRRIMR